MMKKEKVKKSKKEKSVEVPISDTTPISIDKILDIWIYVYYYGEIYPLISSIYSRLKRDLPISPPIEDFKKRLRQVEDHVRDIEDFRNKLKDLLE